jgi:ubiquinol-cytochrome c reductase cytochrome b subunit
MADESQTPGETEPAQRGWLDERLNLGPVLRHLLDEPIPGGASWIYIFGSVTLFLFVNQALTGMFLALYYAPTPDSAYASVRFIQESVTLGAFVRGMHHWGASAMMVAIGLHILQVYLYGAYKPPREPLWTVGVLLLFLTLAFGFTGYLLPWDQRAYWATQVGVNMIGTVPVIGDALARIARGGEELGALTLSRFYAIHTLFLPAAVAALIALHLFILRRVGPAGPFDEKRARATSEPFYPRQVYMDAVAILGVFAVVITLAAALPASLSDQADPSSSSFVPKPEWYFLFYYQLLKYFPGRWEAFATVALPVIFVGLLFALPFLGKRDRCPASRPVAIFAGGAFLAAVFMLMGESIRQDRLLARGDGLKDRGKALYQQLGCGGCHRVHGVGGAVGPDLSYVGDTRDRDWLMRHFRDPQSVVPGSIMPKTNAPEADLEALTAYILSLKKSS